MSFCIKETPGEPTCSLEIINSSSIFVDIFLINNFGPHLLTFMFFYLLINKVYKYFINQGQLIIVLSNLLFVLLLFIMEKALIYFVYGLNINFYNLLQCIIFSTILFYPIYLILNKIKSNL